MVKICAAQDFAHNHAISRNPKKYCQIGANFECGYIKICGVKILVYALLSSSCMQNFGTIGLYLQNL